MSIGTTSIWMNILLIRVGYLHWTQNHSAPEISNISFNTFFTCNIWYVYHWMQFERVAIATSFNFGMRQWQYTTMSSLFTKMFQFCKQKKCEMCENVAGTIPQVGILTHMCIRSRRNDYASEFFSRGTNMLANLSRLNISAEEQIRCHTSILRTLCP